MRRLLRQMAWLLARLMLVVALCFGVLSTATHSTRRDFGSDRVEQLQRPRFFNRMPTDVVVRSRALVAKLARAEDLEAEDELLRLGGAAFPYLLPQLATLSPDTRNRVAWALLPAARRMGWRGAAEVDTPGAAASFFERAWVERASDFHPSIAERWVQRLARRATPGLRASVVEYDTFALPALVAALPRVSTPSDVLVASRITQVAAHVTGLDWRVPVGASPESARLVVEQWQRWWQLHSFEYVILRGPSRWAAMLTETQFGGWLVMATTFNFGNTLEGARILSVLVPATANTLMLMALATLGGSLCLFARERYLDGGRSGRLLARIAWIRPLVSAIPPIGLIAGMAALLPKAEPYLSAGLATLVCSAITTLTTSRSLQIPNTVDGTSAGSNAVVDARFNFSLGRWMLQQWQHAGHVWPLLLLLVFVIERAFRVPGLSQFLVVAFHQRDLHSLMAITTTTAFCLMLVVGFRRNIRAPSRYPSPSFPLQEQPQNVGRLQRALPLALTVGGVALALVSVNPAGFLVMLAWTLYELTGALLLAVLIASLSILAAGRRSTRLLDLAVSRFLEVAAALPIVLACVVVVVITGWWMPIAIACVTGVLNGLSCLRDAIRDPLQLLPYQAKPSILALLLIKVRQTLRGSVAVVLAQVVEIEAAIVFLGLCAAHRQGGVGQTLGAALSSGRPLTVVPWLVFATGSIMLLRLAAQLLALRASPSADSPQNSNCSASPPRTP